MLENPQTERVATTENPFTPPTEGQASVGMQENDPSQAYDFTYVPTIARIALYDDLRSAPRITEIQPATTAEYIENLASKIYEQAKLAGGTIPYTVIREVTENFIHARFAEIIVSILDQGNTIRFADQGPGINQKEKAQLPGFTSAIEPMKRYIRGVGSGLPIVREYLDYSHGTISIEDNLGTGAVVTISLSSEDAGPTNAIAATPQTSRGQAAPACSLGASSVAAGTRIPSLLFGGRRLGGHRSGEPHRRRPFEHLHDAQKDGRSRTDRKDRRPETHFDRFWIPGSQFTIIMSLP